jgi:hypothetical protein
MDAVRLNPSNIRAPKALEGTHPLLKGQTPDPQPADVILDTSTSLAPRTLIQVRRDADGKRIRDGIEVEFHENSRLKYFLNISRGKPNGVKFTWETAGPLFSREVYQ